MLINTRRKRFTNINFPIPSGKIFEKLLNLEEELTGQSITIHSVFTEDNTPSMIIYFATSGGFQLYKFKDFSSGYSGDAVDLFLLMHGEEYKITERNDAFYKILDIFKEGGDYLKALETSGRQMIPIKKEVSNYEITTWKKNHADYMREYGITPAFTKEYLIKPLAFYEMTMTRGSSSEVLRFEDPLIFGYFNKAGELCKIYNPGKKKGKFIKVKTLIQGYEQLKPNKKYCLIMAGLKDMGSFHGLGYTQFNIIAPESENVELSEEIIQELISTHDVVFTMLDNDSEGIKRMLMYKEKHQLPFIHFNVEKDIAQCRKSHGEIDTKEFFSTAFKKYISIHKNKKQ